MTVDEMKQSVEELTQHCLAAEAARNHQEQLRLRYLGAIEVLNKLIQKEEEKAAKAVPTPADELLNSDVIYATDVVSDDP